MADNIIKVRQSPRRKHIMLFVFGCLLGTVFFLAIYGVKVLNVQYVDWLMQGGDITQHYLGWVFFRKSPWHFPIGLMDGLAYPALTSIMYTDSIPLFSLFFKLLSPMLPTDFQFFGIWGIMAFALQGGISSLIIYKIKSSIPVALIGSVFFIISPVVLQRMYGHTALAGHFMILLPIVIWFYQETVQKGYKEYIVWGAMGALAVLIHGYFVPMVGGFLCGYLLDNYILRGFNWKKIVSLLGTYFCAVLMTMFALGAFYGPSEIATGFDPHSSNINSLFNSTGAFSIFLPGLTVGSKQYEGFAYLGFGMLALVVAAVVISIVHRANSGKKQTERSSRKKTRVSPQKRSAESNVQTISKDTYLTGCLIFVAVVFFLVSVGPADRSMTRLVIGMEQLIRMFRSHGRFIWCTMYVIMLGVIGCVTNKTSFRVGVTLIFCCAVLQTADLSKQMRNLNSTFNREVVYEHKTIVSERWEEIAKSYRHIVILPYNGEIATDMDNIFEFAIFAGKHDMTVNQMYLARKSDESFQKVCDDYLEEIANGTVSEDILFILEDSELNGDALKLKLSTLDGYVLGSKNGIAGLETYAQ